MTCHLLVIGAQRCGTTYLHSLLDAHPQITMARPARPEPKVFLSDDLADRGGDWYRETYFAHARDQKVLGEKSTSYIEDPQAPARVRRSLGRTQIVAMLRDPVQRAISNWRFSTDNGFESRPLEVALRENLHGARPWDGRATSVSPFAYLERGRYADYLVPWFQAFQGSVHVHFLSELRRNDREVERLYASLGVDPTFRPERRAEAVNSSLQPAPDLPTALSTQLRDYFRESDDALIEGLGRPLPWPSRARGANDE